MPNANAAATTVRRRFDASLIAVFCIAIGLPTSGRLLNWGAPYDPQIEKRPAASAPTLELRNRGPLPWPRKASLLAFPQKFEAYFNDQIGFRQELLRGFAAARLAGVVPAAATNVAAGASDQVLIGRNHWLYLGGKNCVDMYRGTRPFAAAELEAWRQTLRRRHDWLAARGIGFLFFVAPDKHSIYPEFLPRSAQSRSPVSRLDQLVDGLDGPDGVELLDVRPTLRQARRDRQVYLQGDTHWNAYGARLAYGELMQRLQRRLTPGQTMQPDDYELCRVDSGLGDLAAMLQSSSWPEEGNLGVRPRQPPRAQFREERTALGDGRYAVVLQSENAAAPALSVLVLHDSFFVPMQPWLSEQFRTVTYVMNHETDFPTDLIERERPDFVVFEIVERYLMGSLPDVPLPVDPATQRLPTAARPGSLERR